MPRDVVRLGSPLNRKTVGIVLLFGTLSLAQAQTTNNLPRTRDVTLQEVVRRVLEENESVQMKMLEAEISRKTWNAEKGIYEPAVVGSLTRVDSQRPNNVQQARTLLSAEFNERNTLYDGGLEFLTPIGSRFKLGTSFRDLHNNLQKQGSVVGTSTNRDHEYESFVGVSLVQPLLKNFGVNATEVRIRLAAAASDLAFQDYRRQLMLTVGRSASAYWDLYLTQEQERISQESIAVADAILIDNQNRLKVGRSSELEVLQSDAGLALRKARYSEAHTKNFEAGTQLASILSRPALETNLPLRAIDRPAIREVPLSYFLSYQQAFQLNPDFLSRKVQIKQETIRLAYARNQRLPQLDLKANYGFNGLGDTPSSAWDDVGRSDYPTWNVGVEMRIPITGGVRERNELEAAKLGHQRALLGLKEIEVQIGNALESAMHKTRSYLDNVQSYESVVQFHEQLLASQFDRLKVGRLDSRTVLETEEKLFEAKIAALENMIQYQKAFLEMELVTGSTLMVRNVDITKPQLQAKTAAFLKDRLSDVALEKYVREAARQYHEDLSPSSLTTRQALDVLHNEMSEQDLQAQRKALELLRQRMQETEAAQPGQIPKPTQSLQPASPTQAQPNLPATRPASDAQKEETQRKALDLLRQRMQEIDQNSPPAQKR